MAAIWIGRSQQVFWADVADFLFQVMLFLSVGDIGVDKFKGLMAKNEAVRLMTQESTEAGSVSMTAHEPVAPRSAGTTDAPVENEPFNDDDDSVATASQVTRQNVKTQTSFLEERSLLRPPPVLPVSAVVAAPTPPKLRGR